MSYYNQGGGGGYYGGSGSGGPQQPPEQQQQQQQPYGYAGVYGQQQQQPPMQPPQSYSVGDPYNAAPQQQYNNNEQQQPQHANLWQQQQYPQPPQQQQHLQPLYGSSSYSNTPNIFGASAGTTTLPQQQPFFNPNMMAAAAMAATSIAAGNNNNANGTNALLDVGYAAGQSFLQNSTARMVPGLESTVRMLRPYFAVDNRYVLQKMKRVAVPFFYQSWKRTVREVAPTPDHRIPPVAYHLPLHDDCAPDLYLPLMAGITYVLLSALLYGTAGKFNPEVIPDVCTKCFLTQILEVLALWLGFYMMRAGTHIAVLDLFCYTGYKYQGLCWNMLVGLLLSHLGINGTRAYYVMFLYTGTAAFYFMLKTTANAIPLQLPPGTPPREMMVLAFGASQFATMWLVGQTKFL